MKRAVRALGFLVCVFSYTYAREFLYPVAAAKRESGDYVYLIHQISLTHLQLLQMDLESNAISPALSSGINPTGIKILPDNSGYSFLDQGSLYIKYFSKRSPVKIDISLPLYQIEMLEWIDPASFYFSARYQDQFSIYQASTSGQLDLLMQSENDDCIYPQKIDETLFYIKRSFDKANYRIESLTCTPTRSYSTILMGNQPIAFLHMTSSMKGYYLSYPPAIESNAPSLLCTYHQLSYNCERSEWSTERLFEFSIPMDLILPDSKERLYESLLPLLPKHTKQGIYYCNCIPEQVKKKGLRNLGGEWYDPEFIKIYFYEFLTRKTSLKTHDNNRDTIAPLITEKNVLYGHSMTENSKNKELLPGMWHNEYGQTCYEIPKLSIS